MSGDDDQDDDGRGDRNETPADEERAEDRSADESTPDETTADDPATDDAVDADQSDPKRTRSDEFGIASDLVSGRSGDADDGVTDTEDRATGDETDDDPAFAKEARSGDAADAPLSSLASSVAERRDRATDRPDDELFDEEDVPEIDADVVWQRLGEDEPPELPEETDHDVRVIEKRDYCEQCPYFATPPEVRCTHEGTEILELVDMERFRVVDCPKVREDERLERI